MDAGEPCHEGDGTDAKVPIPAPHASSAPTSTKSHPLKSSKKAEHENSRANRRGPMDEMRQILRILAKIIPKTEPLLKSKGGDDSGGNRVTQKEIEAWLVAALGDAPVPAWSLPQGWGQYIAGARLTVLLARHQRVACARRGSTLPHHRTVAFEMHSISVGMHSTSFGVHPLSFEMHSTVGMRADARDCQSCVSADVFNWALGEERVTADQARLCAHRGTGRPWEAKWDNIHKLGVFSPSAIPLCASTIRSCSMCSRRVFAVTLVSRPCCD